MGQVRICRYHVGADDPDAVCEQCTAVATPGPMDDQIAHWLRLANMKELGVSLMINDISIRDEQGMIAVSIARSMKREKDREREKCRPKSLSQK